MQPDEDASFNELSVLLAFEDVLDDAMEGRHFRGEGAARPGLGGYLGIDHRYGKADVTIDGETIAGVGLRYKGNGTFIEGRMRNTRLPLKIDFKEFDETLEFRGLTKINLHNSVADPSMLREALSYELFREAGVHCSQVGFAKVSLTVTGESEQKPLGLYTVVEQVNERFLADRFGSTDGLLMKPSSFGVFLYFGTDWAEYEKAYVPKTDPRPEQQERVIEFARLLHEADDPTFDSRVDEYLDTDQFLRFVAVNVLLSNLDSFLGATQNYYVYLEPTSNRFQFLPWDMDHSFGAFPLLGTPQSRCELSIDHPGGEKNTLIERVLGIPRHRETYRAYLAEYLDTIFAQEKMRQQISDAADFVRRHISINGADALTRFERAVADGPSEHEPHVLKVFVRKRRASVQGQLDGLSDGEILFGDMKRLPVRRIIGLAIAFGAGLLLNLVGWVWSLVAGFRGSVGWGLLNLFLYPIAPMVYGFSIRKDLGRRSAILALLNTACGVAWLVTVIVTVRAL